jgi:UDP-glucuronate 4-epimerase
MRHALITGGAGFIGSHLVDRLLAEGWRTTVVDSFDDYYSPAIKSRNIQQHTDDPRFRLVRVDIRDAAKLRTAVRDKCDVIVHLAAKAGVRPSIADPLTYLDVNVRGTQSMLELARALAVPRFIFASSSSVYGINRNVPWREDDRVLQPISPYASTKVSGELLGHVYTHLYGMSFVALRFFTVYGPRQRPDLAIHKFARRMLRGAPIPFFGDGSTRRDYTYVDDIVSGVRAAMEYSSSKYEVINLGNNRTVSLAELIRELEIALGAKAKLDRQPEQPGDVPQTWAEVSKAETLLSYRPHTPLAEGLRRFANWLATEESSVGARTDRQRSCNRSASTPFAQAPLG